MYLSILGLVYLQCSPLSRDVSSPRRFSFHLFQALFHFYSSLYTTLYLQGPVNLLRLILLLTLLKYCCVVWYTLLLLAFCTHTGVGALFLYATHITCIAHIPLMPWLFSMLLFLSFVLQCEHWRCFPEVSITFQPVRVFFTILHNMSLWSFTLAKLSFLFIFVVHSGSSSVFLSFSTFNLTFFATNYTSLIKWYSHFCFFHSLFLVHFSVIFAFADFISPYDPYQFVCCCIHVAWDSSFCFIINLFEAFQSSTTFLFLWI